MLTNETISFVTVKCRASSKISDELDLPMTSLCFPVAIGPVRRQDRWRAAKIDGDFHAKEETLAYEPT
jgi:hypothetical protein